MEQTLLFISSESRQSLPVQELSSLLEIGKELKVDEAHKSFNVFSQMD